MHLLQWRKLAWRCLTTGYYQWITHILMQIMAMRPPNAFSHRHPPPRIHNYSVAEVESGRSMQQLKWKCLLVNLPLWSCTLLTFVLESRATVATLRHGHNHLRSMPLMQTPSAHLSLYQSTNFVKWIMKFFYFHFFPNSFALRRTLTTWKVYEKFVKYLLTTFSLFWIKEIWKEEILVNWSLSIISPWK